MISWILQFLGGLWLFLFGLDVLEKALIRFSRGNFKTLLKKYTNNNFSATCSGIIATILTQSSNLISIVILAFVGTGMLSLTAGLAVMLGANIGTTIPEAILGTIGLSYDIKIFTFPLIFLWAIGISFFGKHEKVVDISRTLMGLAIVFLAMIFMKEGLTIFTQMLDITEAINLHSRLLFGIWILLTLGVQSGGAIFIVTLTGVSSGLIPAEAAFPLILGSYLGSTITIVLGSLGNQPAIKKQVAVGHVFFNIIFSFLGMICLPLIYRIFQSYVFPRIGTITWISFFYVWFRTIVAIVIFPFLKPMSNILEKIFKDKHQRFTLAIHQLDQTHIDIEMGVIAIKQDLLIFTKEVIEHNLSIRDLKITKKREVIDAEKSFTETQLKKEYGDVKNIEEQLLQFLRKLNQTEEKSKRENQEIGTIYQAIIDLWISSKSLKDVWNRVEDWQRNENPKIQKRYIKIKTMVRQFYESVIQVIADLDNQEYIQLLHKLMEEIKKNEKKSLSLFSNTKFDNVELANIIQVQYYFTLSCRSIVKAIEEIVLTQEEIDYITENFDELMNY